MLNLFPRLATCLGGKFVWPQNILATSDFSTVAHRMEKFAVNVITLVDINASAVWIKKMSRLSPSFWSGSQLHFTSQLLLIVTAVL